jgi:hypothetical protein
MRAKPKGLNFLQCDQRAWCEAQWTKILHLPELAAVGMLGFVD